MKGSQSTPALPNKELSIQAQLEMNDVPEYANEPGPGHYFGPESKGFSSMAHKYAKEGLFQDKMIEFPRTGWPDWKKVIISKGHEGPYKLRDSPGCVYAVPESSVKKKTYSVREETGSDFPAAQRPDLSLSLGMNPKGSPGPATYNTREVKVREQVNAGKGGKIYGQMDSKAERFDSRTSKGPGPYSRKDVALNPSTGKSFGCCRASYDKVIRPGWEKDGQCKTSSKIGEGTDIGPGISNYTFEDGYWKEKTYFVGGSANRFKSYSTAKNGRCYSIGTAERFPKDRVAASSPGPGQYKRDERDVSKAVHKNSGINPGGVVSSANQRLSGEREPFQGSVVSDTRNPTGAPFGRRMPRKPRFRQMLALQTAERGGWGYF
jgi:hypothetical protein